MVRLLTLIAAVSYLVGLLLAAHGHASGPSNYAVHLSAPGLMPLAELLVIWVLALVVIMAELLVVERDAFARGEPGSLAGMLAVARRLVRCVHRLVAPPVGTRVLQARRQERADTDDGILHQLQSALLIAPAAPPSLLALIADRLVRADDQLMLRRTA
ncbi:MAG: hypothetical protein ACRDYY_13450 [Acidimicrobiales bacterium]